MSGQTRPRKGQFLSIVALSVLVGLVLTSVLVPLKPITQQALIGITLIWLGFGAMVGFNY
jgi:hypothetical protein